MHRQNTLAICEPLDVLRGQITAGATDAGFRSQPMDNIDEADTRLTPTLIAYVHHENFGQIIQLISNGMNVIALHDRHSQVGIANLVAGGAKAVLPRGATASMGAGTLTLEDNELLIVPRQVSNYARINTMSLLNSEERSWLAAAASGATVGQIARETGQSERTLQRRFQGIYRQLAVGSLTEALILAAAFGLVGPLA